MNKENNQVLNSHYGWDFLHYLERLLHDNTLALEAIPKDQGFNPDWFKLVAKNTQLSSLISAIRTIVEEMPEDAYPQLSLSQEAELDKLHEELSTIRNIGF